MFHVKVLSWAVFYTVSDITALQNAKKSMTSRPQLPLNASSRNDTCEFMYDLYIAETCIKGAIFLWLQIGLLHSLLRSFCIASSEKNDIGEVMRYGCPVSCKVIEIGSSRKPVCDFFLVTNNNVSL